MATAVNVTTGKFVADELMLKMMPLFV